VSRALDDLAPDVAEKARALLELAAEAGAPLVIVQTLRTDEEQEALWAKGRERPGAIVTNAQAGQSWHGPMGADGKARAFDVAFRQGTWVTWEGPWGSIGALGESLGLTWGGRWPGFPDRPHFEDPGGKTLAQWRAEYEPTAVA
jgi:peptidoglycan L-alanyl-D-glutamate endopeptidase CwlK